MAKKSLIAGEYIIEIADNGHVDVLRVFRNAKVTMEEIAKSKNFPVDEKWNTQDLGRHLVKEFGDGKTALFNDITINRFADGKIEIYQECKNVKEALRTIANQLGFHYEDTWNTQQFGSKLSDYLIEHKEEADKILQTKNARRKKENTEEALNISPTFGISETNKPINSNNMAKFNLTGSKTVAELKKEFNEAFGSRLKVYNGGSVADDNETLGNLGLKEDTAFECRSSRTAASFIESFKELGLKVTVWTRDYNVKVLDGLTLKSTGEIKNMATKKDMEDKIAYQREEADEKIADKEETNHDGSFNLLEKLKTAFIVEDDDDVWYDAESADDEDKEEFVNNLLGICGNPGLIKLLKFDNAQALVDYLDNDPHDLNLAYGLITAAYMTKCGFDLDSRVYVDFKDYYFNDCMDFHYEYNTDIDWG